MGALVAPVGCLALAMLPLVMPVIVARVAIIVLVDQEASAAAVGLVTVETRPAASHKVPHPQHQPQ